MIGRYWEFRNGIIVREAELDCDLHKFDVYDRDTFLGTVYPASLEDMTLCINELRQGNDPISAKWEDGCDNARDIQEILGAEVPTEEEWKALEEYGEYVYIDLGYVIPGLLMKA